MWIEEGVHGNEREGAMLMLTDAYYLLYSSFCQAQFRLLKRVYKHLEHHLRSSLALASNICSCHQ